jgi:hypothetical protein
MGQRPDRKVPGIDDCGSAIGLHAFDFAELIEKPFGMTRAVK